MPRARLAGVAAYVRPNPSPLGLPGLTAPVRAAAGVGHRTSALPAARPRFVAACRPIRPRALGLRPLTRLSWSSPAHTRRDLLVRVAPSASAARHHLLACRAAVPPTPGRCTRPAEQCPARGRLVRAVLLVRTAGPACRRRRHPTLPSSTLSRSLVCRAATVLALSADRSCRR